MRILGIGVDIIENKRIKNSIKNHRFKDRIYSSKELKQSTLSKDKIGFQPWITLSDDEEIFLKDQHIMTIVTPDIKLQNEYNRVFGSGIIIPGDEGIIG